MFAQQKTKARIILSDNGLRNLLYHPLKKETCAEALKVMVSFTIIQIKSQSHRLVKLKII
jgi:hypothetical protein